MHFTTRFLSFALAALLVLAPLSGCGKDTPVGTDPVGGTPADTNTAETTVPVETEPPIPQYAIIENGTSNFKIVRSDLAKETVVQAAIALRKAFEAKYNYAIPLETDWVKKDDPIPTDTFEILVGTTNRAESIAAAEKLNDGEFIIEVASPNRIVILGYSEEATAAAVNAFAAQYIDSADGASFTLSADTHYTGAVYNSYAKLRTFESNLILAPSIITRAASLETLTALKEKAPTTIVVDFTDGKAAGASLGEAMKQIMPNSMPAFRVETQQDAEALMKQIAILSIKDYFVMTSNTDIITYVVATDSNARCILDYTGYTKKDYTDADLFAFRQTANKFFARVVLLPEWMADTETVAYLQSLQLSVWVDGGESDTTTELVRLITSGANGIITAAPAELEACYTKYFDENTFARRFFVTGHRGMPSKAPENTVEGSLLAYENGADVIENDVYLSADGVVVVMHDKTIDRTTNGTGNIESMTVAQLKQYRVNKQFGDTYPNCEIPTLAEYFEAFKDNDAHIFIEIKSGKTAIVQKVYDEIQKYNFEDRVTIIAFGTAIMKECKRVCPEITVGYLVSNYSDPNDAYASIVKVNELVGSYHTTFNPNAASVSEDFVREANYRGITLWPWTINDIGSYVKFLFWGINGVTTNYSNFSAKMYRSISVDNYNIEAKVGTAVTPVLTLDRYDRYEAGYDPSMLKVIFLEGADIAKV
ncbi:MAG: hypothetical protein IJC15_00500, partial [Clostridia bacterium]|nr:hypothetical protein [Clostridia bacterium]